MSWREVSRKVFDCDGCGQEMRDPEFGTQVTFPLDAELRDYDISDEAGWATIEGKTYCPGCWHYCEGIGWHPVLGKVEDCTDAECIEARA